MSIAETPVCSREHTNGVSFSPIHPCPFYHRAVSSFTLGTLAADAAREASLAIAKDKGSGKKLMGFGHRVYKNYDPRAKIIKKACDEVLGKLEFHDPLLDIAKKLEEAALKDSYFVERKLYPNVDFYSGIIMRALGIPVEMFTVMFAIGRMPGWIANYKEVMEEPTRIYRPRQIYVGPTLNHYVPLKERK